MKKLCTVLLVFTVFLLQAQDQTENTKSYDGYQYSYLGLGLVYNDISEKMGVQIRAKSDIKNSRFSSAIYFTIYGKQETEVSGRDVNGDIVALSADYRIFDFMVDVHYNIAHRDFKFYPFIGFGLLNRKINADVTSGTQNVTIDDATTSLASNFGLGLQFKFMDFLSIFAEPKINIYFGDGFYGEGFLAFQGGVMYTF